MVEIQAMLLDGVKNFERFTLNRKSFFLFLLSKVVLNSNQKCTRWRIFFLCNVNHENDLGDFNLRMLLENTDSN
jgi:hypothetical protein